MLTIRTRQQYLTTLGFYKGKINGVENNATRAAYLALQKKYFVRKSDQDGLYGPNTDILLLNAIRVHNRSKNFNLTEFKCDCGGRHCTGYPTYLSKDLLDNIQKIRTNYGQPVTITSGLRCKKRNAEVGGISTSKHLKGKAVDFYIPGHTDTEAQRLATSKYWMKMKNSNYSYAYLPTKYRAVIERVSTGMGNAVHGDVK